MNDQSLKSLVAATRASTGAIITFIVLALTFEFSELLVPKFFPAFDQWLQQSHSALTSAKARPTSQTVTELENLLREVPGSGEVRFWLARVKELSGATNAAIIHYQRLLGIDDTGPFVVQARKRLRQLGVQSESVVNPIKTTITGYDASATNSMREVNLGTQTILATPIELQRLACEYIRLFIAASFWTFAVILFMASVSREDVLLIMGLILTLAFFALVFSANGSPNPFILLSASLCLLLGLNGATPALNRWILGCCVVVAGLLNVLVPVVWLSILLLTRWTKLKSVGTVTNSFMLLASFLMTVSLHERILGCNNKAWHFVSNGWTPTSALGLQLATTVILLGAAAVAIHRDPRTLQFLLLSTLFFGIWEIALSGRGFLSSSLALNTARTVSLLCILAGGWLQQGRGEMRGSPLLGFFSNVTFLGFWCLLLPLSVHALVYLKLTPYLCVQMDMTMPTSFWETPAVKWAAPFCGTAMN
jgi:hypothetical protein